jgi:ketosteroid isomerase-like protein
MSQDHLEIVKRLMDAVNLRDIDALAEVTTSDLEWFPVFAARVEGDLYRGREGIETFLGEVDETWEEFLPVPEEYRDLGDRVLALGWLKTRGRASGVPVDSPWGGIYDFAATRFPASAPSSTTTRRCGQRGGPLTRRQVSSGVRPRSANARSRPA